MYLNEEFCIQNDESGLRIADIYQGWSIEHGFVTFNGPGMDRRILNTNAQTAVQATQGAFLKISRRVSKCIQNDEIIAETTVLY